MDESLLLAIEDQFVVGQAPNQLRSTKNSNLLSHVALRVLDLGQQGVDSLKRGVAQIGQIEN